MRRRIMVGVAGLSRLWLRFAVSQIKIKNHQKFLETIRNRSGSLLSVSNHISTLDDPLIWGALLDGRQVDELVLRDQMRWTVGAKELTFTNPITSWFFQHGQVIPIVRGDGIYQPAMDDAISVLNKNKWLHFFPQGKVIQNDKELGRLKWGVGRLIMESHGNMTILPLILKGFDLMKPNELLPVTGHAVEIVIGDPIDSKMLLRATELIKDVDERRSLITKGIQDILNRTRNA